MPWFGKIEYIDKIIQPVNWNKSLDDKFFLFELQKLFKRDKTATERFVIQFSIEIAVAFLIHINYKTKKNTSIDGLRQTFLQREGKLIQKDEKYKLIVERKTQDVLLEKIDWNISIIKLPWIEKILFVEW